MFICGLWVDTQDLRQLSEVLTLNGGLGEAYTPTVIGVDGTVYAINDAVVFAIGK